MPNQFDVIVVGSGPAGATAAYRLARDGFKTLLLEKEKLPRYKACGGALTQKVFQKIDFDIAPLVEDQVTHITLAYRQRALVNLDFAQPPVALVMRDKFDNYLTERAALVGAVVHDAEPVKHVSFEASGVRVITNAGEYTSEIVVGADGANGITARAANLSQPRSIAAALEVELAVSDAHLDAWRNQIYLDFGAIPYGYAWIFPKADHLSVGIGTYVRGPLFRHFAQRGGEARADLRARLDEWMAREPTLRDARVLIERGHLVPLGGEARATPLHGSRVVLAGDAGGLIEPLFAEGIYYALRSGQIAAEVIADAFRREVCDPCGRESLWRGLTPQGVTDTVGNLDLSAHTRRIEAEILPEFQNAAGVSRFTYRFPYVALKALSLAPPLRNSVNRMMGGQAQPSSALWRFVRAIGNGLDQIPQRD